MDYSKIGVRYAKALFEYAEEQKLTDLVVEDIRLLYSNLKENPELLKYFSNPVTKSSAKSQMVDDIYGKHFQKLTCDFMKLVIQHRREEHFPAICRRVDALYKEKFGIRNLKIRSVVEMNPELQKRIEAIVKEALNAKSLELSTELDPDLIGGFVLDMDDLRFDASVKAQISELHNKLLK